MDKPETRKEGAVEDDKADPAERGGWFFGPDAVGVLRRGLRWGVGVAGIGCVLAGVAVWRLWVVSEILRDIALALKGR